MQRKWTILAAAMASVTVLAGGLSFADDDESPLHKIMEKVQANNVIITKGTRNPAAFKKSAKEVVKASEELVKLAKEAKPIKDAAKKAKEVPNPEATWEAYCDDLAKTADALAKVAAKAGATQPQAKEAFAGVKKACADCHKPFRVEDEGFK